MRPLFNMEFQKQTEAIQIFDDDDEDSGKETCTETPRAPVQVICRNPRQNPLFHAMFVSILRQKRLDAQQVSSSLSTEFNTLSLRGQFAHFCLAVSESPQGANKRNALVIQLTNILRQIYGNCIVYPIGSSSSSLADDDSDLDIFVYVPSGSNSNPTSIEVNTKHNWEINSILDKVTALLHRKTHFAVKIATIPKAKVPILKFTHKTSGIQCDLNFSGFLGVRKTRFISFYMALHPIVPILLRIVNYWAKFHGLVGPVNIKTYCLNLLVLFYCGSEGIIPSLREMKKVPGISSDDVKLDRIDGLDTFLPSLGSIDLIRSSLMTGISAPTDIDLQGPSFVPTLLRLLSGFFSFYGKLDFESNQICTNTFNLQSSTVAGSLARLRRGKTWIERRGRSKLPVPLCVQDPLQLQHNVGYETGASLLKCFQECCLKTRRVIQDGQVLQVQSILALFCPQNSTPMKKVVSFLDERHTTPNRIGKDFGTIGLRLTPVDTFVRQFARSAIQVGSDNSFSLTQKMKRLWITFASDFINMLIKDSLQMKVVSQKSESIISISLDEPDSASAESPMKYPQSAFRKEEYILQERKNCPQNLIDVPEEQKIHLQNKIDLLQHPKKKMTCTTIHIRGSPFLLLSSQERNNRLLKEVDQSPPNKKMKIDPLKMEQRVTEIIKDRTSNRIGDNGDVEIKMCIKLDCRVVDELPCLDLSFPRVAPYAWVNGISQINCEGHAKTLAAIVLNTFQDYMLFRLKEWIVT